MLKHIFSYEMKSLLRQKGLIWWTLLFPILLTTLMYFAFGNLFEVTEGLHVIDVAVVEEKEDPVFFEVMTSLSEEGEDKLLEVSYEEKETAKKRLEKEEVAGIIYVGDEPYLEIKENGIDPSVLQIVLNQYIQYKKTLTDIAVTHPEKIEAAAAQISQEAEYFVDKSNSSSKQDNLINFFYAIFAMTCLFASFAGLDRVRTIQADITVLGQRRAVAPVPKRTTILADFAACMVNQYAVVCLLLVYMKFILKLEVGDKYPAILLLLFAGTAFGVMFGIFVGALPKIKDGIKEGIVTGVSLGMCAISDLMVQGIRSSIEQHAPIINDLNPAALICDSFYALNIYDNYDRFLTNMALLLGITAVLMLLSCVMVRRNRYASL